MQEKGGYGKGNDVAIRFWGGYGLSAAQAKLGLIVCHHTDGCFNALGRGGASACRCDLVKLLNPWCIAVFQRIRPLQFLDVELMGLDETSLRRSMSAFHLGEPVSRTLVDFIPDVRCYWGEFRTLPTRVFCRHSRVMI